MKICCPSTIRQFFVTNCTCCIWGILDLTIFPYIRLFPITIRLWTRFSHNDKGIIQLKRSHNQWSHQSYHHICNNTINLHNYVYCVYCIMHIVALCVNYKYLNSLKNLWMIIISFELIKCSNSRPTLSLITACAK